MGWTQRRLQGVSEPSAARSGSLACGCGLGKELLPAWNGVLLQPGLSAGVEPVQVLKV